MRSLDKLLPVPSWVYKKLERWHHLSFLKARDTMEMLRGAEAHALEPDKIKALLHLIREDLGFRLHRAVQKVKSDLSDRSEAVFEFSDGYANLRAPLKRSVFERWIAEEERTVAHVTVAGKTGTATNPRGRSHAWFVAFAPAENPRVAVAIVVENVGYGATYAAPIARDVIRTALSDGT